jgi:hypothetical protein
VREGSCLLGGGSTLLLPLVLARDGYLFDQQVDGGGNGYGDEGADEAEPNMNPPADSQQGG